MIPIPANLPVNIASKPDALGLVRRLEGGATLTGRVQRTSMDGSTPIQMGSTMLSLILSEPVPPGTMVEVRSQNGQLVVEPKENPSTAQSALTAPSGTPGSPQGTPKAPMASLASFSSNLASILARVLQSHNLPATIENLQILQTALGSFPAEQGPMLALLLAKNVPITPENLAAVRERLRVRGNLGRELGKLSTEANNFLQQGAVRGSERLAAILVGLQELLSWDQTGDLSDRVARLKDFLTSLEEKLLGQQPEKARTDFKSLLLELDFLLSQAELDGNHPMRTALRKVIHLIEGAQLSGLTQLGAADRSDWVFWRIPFPGDPHPTTVELAIRGDRDPEQPERYDPRNLEVLLQVDLSVLGPLRVRIRALNADLRVTLSVVETRFRDFILKEMPILIESLNRVGFEKVAADIQVEAISAGSLADEIDPLKGWEKRFEDPPRSLDIRL
ncbi:MAG: hypothetical protein H3C63_01275 [Candidatus Omnitrophica bacterium]|nr:hypothetical protein [bacterium]MBV6483054.1 hypothetical protein [bacterium]MBW7937504.1 hypothetical protein [Candidatus Omnitrophota bacterium]MCE7906894.1 hypothetical protein [Candidatus Omnitrophica bacterium COP1]